MAKKPVAPAKRPVRSVTIKPGKRELMPAKGKVKPIKPKPTATTKKSGPTVVFPDGSKVGLKDLGKVKPTPKPVKPKPLPTISDDEYFKRQKQYVDSMKKKKK